MDAETFLNHLRGALDTTWKVVDNPPKKPSEYSAYIALSPAAITLTSQKPIKIVFSDFHAARMGDYSIAASLDLLKLHDPYAAPALAAGYGAATAASDCFSLGLIFLDRLSATAVDQLRVGNDIEWPNLLKRWSALPQAPLERLQSLFQQLLESESSSDSPSAERAAGELGQIIRLLQQESGQVQDQFFDQRYRVIRKLGQGTMARTFLVTDNDYPDLGVFAVKQFLNPSSVSEQARAEFLSLQKLRSRHVPYIYDIYPQTSTALWKSLAGWCGAVGLWGCHCAPPPHLHTSTA